MNLDGRRAGLQSLLHCERGHLFALVESDCGGLRCAAARDRSTLKIDLRRIEHDLGGWLEHLDRNRLLPREVVLLEIGSEGELVVDRAR